MRGYVDGRVGAAVPSDVGAAVPSDVGWPPARDYDINVSTLPVYCSKDSDWL